MWIECGGLKLGALARGRGQAHGGAHLVAALEDDAVCALAHHALHGVLVHVEGGWQGHLLVAKAQQKHGAATPDCAFWKCVCF